MNRRVLPGLILLFSISTSSADKLNCTTKVDTNSACASQPCPEEGPAANATKVSYRNDIDPRFDQWLNLRIIGGACVTQAEVTEAYLKLIYIYSCIFPLIHDKQTKDLKPDTFITFGQIMELDNIMCILKQQHGRTFLHRREENDPELIRRKINDFMSHLLKRNEQNSVLMREWLSVILLMIAAKSATSHEDVNGVVGDPRVDCGEGHITISFDTEAPFKGMVFVRNKLEEPECRSPPADEHWHRNTSIRIKLTDCETERRLSMDPPGMFVTTNIVVAFHPQFLTKHDRVYQVMCYYMAMMRTEERTIKINMPGPKLQTAIVPMPICKYEVLDKTPFGPPVHYAQIGQMIYHKWTCETDTKDTFCMVVHSCTVDDGDGNKVELLDQRGCAHDKYLLQNLEYTSDLMAGKEAHVYKYADKSGIFFECQISITVKEPGQEYCDVPVCPDPPRRRRSHFLNETEGRYETPTVTSTSSNASSSIELIGVSNSVGDGRTAQKWSWVDEVARIDQFHNVCLSPISTWVYAGSNALILLLAILSSRHSVQIMLSPPRKEIWWS